MLKNEKAFHDMIVLSVIDELQLSFPTPKLLELREIGKGRRLEIPVNGGDFDIRLNAFERMRDAGIVTYSLATVGGFDGVKLTEEANASLNELVSRSDLEEKTPLIEIIRSILSCSEQKESIDAAKKIVSALLKARLSDLKL